MSHRYPLPALALALLVSGASVCVGQSTPSTPHIASPVDLTSRPGPEDIPTTVQIETVLLNLENISGADQNFTANFAYAARWMDERLRHTGSGDKTIPLNDIWHPRLQIVNRQRLQETFPAEARVSPEGEVKTIQRVWGQFSQPLLLQDFPFDHQKLNLDIVGTGHRTGTVVFVADPEAPSTVAESLAISDWHLTGWNAQPNDFSIAQDARTIPGFRLTLDVQRNYRYHLVNFILPLILIISMSWVVFWINPKNANPRISVSVTAMLTLIAYRFAVASSLPKIGYLTRMDWFILGSSILIFFSLLEVVITSYFAENERLGLATRINKRMRFIAPIAFLIILIFSLIL
jgi:hypothetical protein